MIGFEKNLKDLEKTGFGFFFFELGPAFTRGKCWIGWKKS
jgi:hypothetical protein